MPLPLPHWRLKARKPTATAMSTARSKKRRVNGGGLRARGLPGGAPGRVPLGARTGRRRQRGTLLDGLHLALVGAPFLSGHRSASLASGAAVSPGSTERGGGRRVPEGPMPPRSPG